MYSSLMSTMTALVALSLALVFGMSTLIAFHLVELPQTA